MTSRANFLHALKEKLGGKLMRMDMNAARAETKKQGVLASKESPPACHRSMSGGNKSQLAFGDFFVREHRSPSNPNGFIKAERQSKYTSGTFSEGFLREAELVFCTKLLKSAVWKLDLRSARYPIPPRLNISHHPPCFIVLMSPIPLGSSPSWPCFTS